MPCRTRDGDSLLTSRDCVQEMKVSINPDAHTPATPHVFASLIKTNTTVEGGDVKDLLFKRRWRYAANA